MSEHSLSDSNIFGATNDRCGGDAMSVAPAVKRELEPADGSGARKRRKQAAPVRAPPPLDLHKVADMYKSALGAFDLALPAFDPLAAFRLLPRPDPPRIFNPEAYCDLCCKEFCNKYFLKTHRANKHGIYEGEGAGAGPGTPPRRSSDDEPGSTPRRLSPDSARRARDAGFQPDALRRLGVANPEAFCEICCKEYCNKYFLRTHRERRHGAPLASPTSSERDSPPPHMLPLHVGTPLGTPLPTSISTPLSTPLGTPHGTPLPAPMLTPPTQHLTQQESPPLDEPLAGVKCEYDEDARAGQTSPLNLAVEERGASPGSASEELRKLQTMISQLNELAAERLDDEPPPDEPPPDERRGASGGAGSSFCEICNKELCNKYFMRTHMQRMHGIALEQGAALGGVTCDICHKELCSKYFLRVHKHNTHGVPAPAAAAGPPAEPCPLCARRFRGPRALRAHLLAEHAPPAPPPAPRPLDLLARDQPYACSYCPFTTDVLAFLFAHERAHAAADAGDADAAPGAGTGGAAAAGGASDNDAGTGDAGEDEAGAEDAQYSCSRCAFRAGGFAALEAHVRGAHGGGALLAVPRAPLAPLTMQPFVLEEAGGALSLLPALVFLPVRRRATRRATVTLTLTPA